MYVCVYVCPCVCLPVSVHVCVRVCACETLIRGGGLCFPRIGYFSVPIATRAHVKQLICLEKNPVSFAFLRRNLDENRRRAQKTSQGALAVAGEVNTLCGDNRVLGDQYLARADRVLMGYIPTPRTFLPRAFSFLRHLRAALCTAITQRAPTTTSIVCGFLHYHHTCTKAEYTTLALQHCDEQLRLFCEDLDPQRESTLTDTVCFSVAVRSLDGVCVKDESLIACVYGMYVYVCVYVCTCVYVRVYPRVRE
jgi:Met-10+ like-protein